MIQLLPSAALPVSTAAVSELTVTRAVERYRAARAAQPAGSTPPRLEGISATGVVRRVVRHPSGRIYLTISDSAAELEVVVFKRARRAVPARLAQGDRVRIRGTLAWYVVDQRIQLELAAMEVLSASAGQGRGAMAEQTSLLLAAPVARRPLGPRGRTLPELPEAIGVVTAPESAALADIVSVLQRRAPAVRVVLSPAQLQGEGAAESILRALQRLRAERCDVVVIARGGSVDGYAALDDERLAQAIVVCPVPVVAAIGHAADETLACRVADRAVETPTAAAYEITAGYAQLYPQAARAVDSAESSSGAALARLRAELSRLERVHQQLSAQAGPVSVTVLPADP